MNSRIRAITTATLVALAGCGSPSQDDPGASFPAVEPDIKISGKGGVPESVTRAIFSNPLRTEDARERDPRSKPEVILTLLNLQPGQRVIDLFGGSGYYTDLMVAIVGPSGQVILHNNTPYHTFVDETVQERYIDDPIAGIRYLKAEVDNMQLEPESLDAALMVLAYHDLYYFDPGIGFGKTDVPLFFSQVHAALKPGGKLLIVDHAADAGTGSEVAQLLHRIDEEFAKRDIESYGFKLVDSSDALRNPEDNRGTIVFDAAFRGKTDRFILLFEKI
jgi:predicted methyltransferase